MSSNKILKENILKLHSKITKNNKKIIYWLWKNINKTVGIYCSKRPLQGNGIAAISRRCENKNYLFQPVNGV